MANKHSYTITVDNNQTKKEAFDYLLATDSRFIKTGKADRKRVMEILGLDKRYSRAFDLVIVKNRLASQRVVEFDSPDDITLVELKTTKKKLVNNPEGFFFGATENEFELARLMGDRYKFCFVSLHPESKSYALLTSSELEKMIKTKRIQYQINL